MTVPKMDANGNITLDIKPVLIHIILFFAIDLERSSTNQCSDRLNKKKPNASYYINRYVWLFIKSVYIK
ncbi:hypothetical protein DAT36_02140 [Photobacterium phosphoreum]|nr:hypothetical protein DAT36_02140 [Photobacterium phosphoreum]